MLRAQASAAVLEQIRAQYNVPGLTATGVKGGHILANGGPREGVGLRKLISADPKPAQIRGYGCELGI